MDKKSQHVSIKKLSGVHIIKLAAAHNLREIQAEIGAAFPINPEHFETNIVMEGPTTAAAVASFAKELMEAAGAEIRRKDAVRAIELLISLPAHLLIDRPAFFSDSLNWAKHYFNVPVLSAVVHLDESSPHCHVLMLPLRDGKMKGAAITGGPGSIMAMHHDFYSVVGSIYALQRPRKGPRLTSSVRNKCGELVTNAVLGDSTLFDKPEVAAAFKQMVVNDPLPIMDALDIGVPYPPKNSMSFVEIMIQPANPEPKTKYLDRSQPPPSPARIEDEKSTQNVSCVRFAESNPAFLCREQGGEGENRDHAMLGGAGQYCGSIHDVGPIVFDDMGTFETEGAKVGLTKRIGDASYLTAAGLLARAGELAAQPHLDTNGAIKNRFNRVLSLARAAGLDEQVEIAIRESFANGTHPGDGTRKGAVLADQCLDVVEVLGKARVGHLLEVDTLH